MSLAEIHRWKSLGRWLPGGTAAWRTSFPQVPLADVLTPRRERVSADRFAECTPITIHFDGSVDERERTKPFKGAMYAAYPGDVVFSKIDVRNGALALLPAAIHKAVVTSEYPVHRPDLKQIDPRYFALVLRSENFLHLLKGAASGTSGRKRVNAESFEELEIPLPEPEEQGALLDNYEKALVDAATLEGEADSIERAGLQEFEAALGLTPPPDLPRRTLQVARFQDIDRWSHEGIIQRKMRASAIAQQSASEEETIQLADYVEVTHGCSASPSARKTGLKVLKISAVTRGVFRPSEYKWAFDSLKVRRRFALKAGDVLMCRVNGTLRYVGRSILVPESMTDTIFPDKLMRVRIVREGLLPEFLARVLQLPTVRAQIESAARTAVGNHAIGSTDVQDLELILPKPKAQVTIMKRFQKAQQEANVLRYEAGQLRESARNEFLTAVFS
jgi:type I restriction enzyme S subunit